MTSVKYELASSRVGSGPEVIILFHGFLGRGRNLASLAQGIVQRHAHYSCVLADLPGHGASPFISQINFDAIAHDVAQWLQSFQQPLRIIGHSLGAKVGLRAATHLQSRCLQLFMLDASPSPVMHVRSEIDRVVEILSDAPSDAPSRDHMREHFTQRGLSNSLTDWLLMNLRRSASGVTWAIDRDALAVFAARFRSVDQWSDVAHVAEKLCVIKGARSAFVSLTDIERFHAMHVPVHSVANAGHFVHVDALPQLLDVLSDVLGMV